MCVLECSRAGGNGSVELRQMQSVGINEDRLVKEQIFELNPEFSKLMLDFKNLRLNFPRTFFPHNSPPTPSHSFLYHTHALPLGTLPQPI